jgi:hypothetical protein
MSGWYQEILWKAMLKMRLLRGYGVGRSVLIPKKGSKEKQVDSR